MEWILLTLMLLQQIGKLVSFNQMQYYIKIGKVINFFLFFISSAFDELPFPASLK